MAAGENSLTLKRGEQQDWDGRVLKNPIHERCAVEYAKGVTEINAYRKARGYPKTHKVDANTYKKIFARAEVQYRIKQLQQMVASEVVERLAYSESVVKDWTIELAEKSRRLVPKRDRGGNPIRVPTPDPNGEFKFEMKMEDAASFAKAIDMASKQLGLYREKPGELDEEAKKSVDELNATIQALTSELGLDLGTVTKITASDQDGSVGEPSEGAEKPEGEPVQALSEAS